MNTTYNIKTLTMKFKSLRNYMLGLGATVLLLSSCEKNNPLPDITASNLKGMFVVCEGFYGQANGDITFYETQTGESTKDLFHSVNGMPAGDIIQSLEIVDTLGFIVVNNSQKVTVVNMKNFKVVKNIEGFSYPRSAVRADNNTVYVSNGNGISGNYIYSIDLSLLEKTDSLEVATGPEKLITANSKIYASISGGWNNDGSSVIEIDPASFGIVNTYEVAPVPVDLVADRNNNIWVYSKGIADYSNYPDVVFTGSGISKINIVSKSVVTLPLSTMSSAGINNIAASIDGGTIYYLNDGLYSLPADAGSLPGLKIADRLFYGLDTDPLSGNIVCLDDVNSKAIVYNSYGIEQFNFETAAYPNSVVFSY